METVLDRPNITPPVFRQTLLSRYAPCKTAMKSDYQIDVFPNGKGDAAFVIRYGKPGDYKILVYDGGTPKTGKEIVAHIRNKYQTDIVDDIICSHPCSDLALGICEILDAMTVNRFWMHRPWIYSAHISSYFNRGRNITTDMAVHIERAFSVPYMLEVVADEREVALFEPFQGTQIGPFTVMSPHRDWYVHMAVPELEDPAASHDSFTVAAKRVIKSFALAKAALPKCLESWETETLREAGEGTPEYEVSIVLYGVIGGRGILLTGNAGVKALSNTARYAESRSLLIPERLAFVQIPRHGDAEHASPSVLDRLIGPKYREARADLTAVIATKPTRGRYREQLVANALKRRGAIVMGIPPTAGRLAVHSKFAPNDHQIIPFRDGELKS
jgi:hypothetical protein